MPMRLESSGMTTPPPEDPQSSDPGAESWARPTDEPVSFDKPAAEQPFDPYRYGAPEHPVPPEYAPPGYQPPPTSQPPAQQPPPAPYSGYQAPYPGQPQYPGQAQYPGQPPYPGQQYPYPPPQYAQYPQPRTGNGKATAALVLGIVSIVFCWTTIFDIVPVVLAIVFGVLGRNEAKRGGSGRSLATTGLVCGVIGAILAVVVSVFLYSRIRPCLDYESGTSDYNTCIQERF
jgi:hypothetical protein